MRKRDVRKILREKPCEKQCEKSAKKIVKNRQKNLWQHSEKLCEKFLWTKKTLLGPQAEPLLSAKKISRNFSLFSGQAVCSPLLEGVGFVTHGTHFRGIVGTSACVCIHPSLPACFPDEAHLRTRVLAYFWQVLLLLVVALDWSSRGGCGRKSLTLPPLLARLKKCQNFKFVFHTVLLQTPPRQEFAAIFETSTDGWTRITRTLKLCWHSSPFWLHLHLHFSLFLELISKVSGRNLLRFSRDTFYTAPIGAFFRPEIRAFTGFGGDLFNRFQSP